MILAQDGTSLTLVGVYRTDGPSAANSTEGRLHFEMAQTPLRSDREMLAMSRDQLHKYVSIASVKAIMTWYENGSAVIETPSVKALVLLGAAGDPEHVLLSLFSKDTPLGLGVCVHAATAEQTKALALEIASSFKFTDKSWASDGEKELDTLQALRGWLPDESIEIRRTHIKELPSPFVVNKK